MIRVTFRNTIRTLVTLSIGLATLFVGACQDDMSLAGEAQAHTKSEADRNAGSTSRQSQSLAATDSKTASESTSGRSGQPSEGPEGSREDSKEDSDQTMTDRQARELLHEDWMEEQPPEAAGTIGDQDSSEDGDNSEDDGLRGVVNLNTASIDDLMMLPGVGPATAARISDYRQKRRFSEPEHLKRIKGIGPKTWTKLKPHVTVEGDTTLSD